MTLQYPTQPSSIRDLWVSHQAIQACIAYCNWKSSPFLKWDGDSACRSEFAHKQRASWIFLKWFKGTSAASNHLLLGRTSRCVPQEPFQVSRNPRKGFAFIQSLAHLFWRRFLGSMSPPSCAVRNGTRRDVRSKSGMPCSLLIITLHEVNGTLPWSSKFTLAQMLGTFC